MGASTTYTSSQMVFPLNWIGKDGIPCGIKVHPSKVVRNVGDGACSGDLMDFQQYRAMTHVDAPSSIIFIPIVFMEWTTLI